jgi:hypothetical protein
MITTSIFDNLTLSENHCFTLGLRLAGEGILVSQVSVALIFGWCHWRWISVRGTACRKECWYLLGKSAGIRCWYPLVQSSWSVGILCVDTQYQEGSVNGVLSLNEESQVAGGIHSTGQADHLRISVYFWSASSSLEGQLDLYILKCTKLSEVWYFADPVPQHM